MKYVASSSKRGTTTSHYYILGDVVGLHGQCVSQSTRRLIMQALRKSCRVLGPGQKSRIGRLGAGTAIGAMAMSFAAPALAQYAAGGGAATGVSSVAIGTGATTANINGVAVGTSNTSSGDGAVAIGNNNVIDTFSAPNTLPFNGILDRALGGNYTFPVGGTSLSGVGIGIGQSNTVDASGIALGSLNQANNATSVTLAIGLGNQANGAYGSAIGIGNAATGTSTIALGTANTASSSTAIAIGRQNTASGQTSIALGNVATANQANAIAVGHSTQATGAGAIAIGGGTGAGTNLDATATRATAQSATAIGTTAAATGTGSTAIGNASVAAAQSAAAFGDGAKAHNLGSTAAGNGAVAGISGGTPSYDTALGAGAQARGSASTAVGASAVASGLATLAGGTGASASGQNAVALGWQADAQGFNALYVGARSIGGTGAIGNSSVAVGTDVTASGGSSIGVGGLATASGQNSIAVGVNANSTKQNSSAFGQAAQATGQDSTSLGVNASASVDYSTALGAGASASAVSALAVGNYGTLASGVNSSAFGKDAVASGPNSTAIGVSAKAPGQFTFAAGDSASAQGDRSVAIGLGATAGTTATATSIDKEVAVGALANAQGVGAASFGYLAQAVGTAATAIGDQAGATQQFATATGFIAKATGNSSTALGYNSKASGLTSIAAGSGTTASGDSSVALGNAATASKAYSIAIGESATASTADNTIAIGRNTSSTGLNGTAIGLNSRQSGGGIAAGNDVTASGLVGTSVGYRTDATGDFSTAVGTSAFAYGDRGVSIGVNTVTGVSGSKTTVVKDVAIGDGAQATGGSAIALGDGAKASASNAISIGTGNVVSGANSGAIGDPNTITGSGSYALGNNNTINANNAFAIGNNIKIATGLNGAVGIGNASTVAAAVGTSSATVGTTTFSGFAGTAPASTVSVGAAGAERTVTNVAAGRISSTSTDAINGSQLFSVAAAVDTNAKSINTLGNTVESIIGAGTSIGPDGSLATAPSFAVAGSTYNNVGAALAALDSGNLVKQTGGSPGTGQITVGAATQGTSISFASSAAVNRTLTGVAAGATTATSVDAVNGSQINTLAASIATNTGGGSVYDPVTGIVTAPTINAAGAKFANTTAAIEALDAGNAKANTGIASAIGGGAAIAPDGTVTAPTVNVNGTKFSNLTDAIQAAGAGYNLTTAAGGSGTVTGTTVESIGAGETVTVVAGNNMVGTQTGNKIELGLNPALTGLTSVAVTGGATIDANGIAMAGDKITGLAAGSTTATSTDAVNGSQLNTALASVATDLGGGASYNPVTGQLTAPGYSIDGTTYTNVGDALTALAADSKYISFNSKLAAANATGTNAAAIGPNAQAGGNNATALGANSDASGNNSTALGSGANSAGVGASALGNNASAGGNNALALGNGATATGTNSVALGAGSNAGINNAGWTGTTFGGQTMTNNVNANAVVSVSGGSTNRQLTGVADGAVNATSTDAISGAQLFNTATALNKMSTNIGAGLASSLGGGASVAADGTVTNPSYTVAGGSQNNVGAALGALNTANNTANTGLAAAIGGGAAVAADGKVTAPVVPVNGTNYSNLTDAITAAGAGFNFTSGKTGSGVANGTSIAAIGAGETHTLTAGDNIITTQTGNDLAVALNPALTGITSLAITSGPIIDGSGITLAAGDTFDAGGNKLSNVAAGSTASGSTDAINGGQLNIGLVSVAANLGGGSTYNPLTGAVTAPAYTIQGTTYGNVGTAFGAVNTNLTSLLNGTSGLVQQVGGSPGSGQLTVGAATGGTSVSFAGTAGDRMLTGVAAGAVTATSVDAINGSQIFANNQQVANLLGAGAGVDALTGALTAPAYILGGNTYSNVGTALGALASGGAGPVQYANSGTPTTANGGTPSNNLTLVGAAAGPVTLDNVKAGSLAAGSTQAVNGGQINTLGTSVASSIGGLAVFDPLTGVVSGTAITVDGTVYTDITSAIQAAGGGLNVTTAATGSGVANGVSVTNIGPGGTSTLTAGNNIITTQTGGTVAVALNPVVTGLTSLAITGGPTLSSTGITGLSAGALSASSTDAVNGSQLFATNQSITNLANGTTGLVQQSPAAPSSGPITVGAASGGTVVDFKNSSGVDRTLTSIAAGATTATSTEAVNGSQMFAGLGSVAANLGGGSTYDPVSGTVTAPAYAVAGGTQGDVGTALAALDTANTKANDGLAAAIGGGAKVAPDGTVTAPTVTAPTVTVGGTPYATLTDAIQAAGAGSKLTTAASGTGVVTGSTIAAVGAGDTTTLTAGNNIVATQNGRDVTLAVNPVLTGLTSVAITGGPTISAAGITGLAAGAVSASSTDAVNGSQLYATNQSIAALTNGSAGLVQQNPAAPSSGPIAVGATTGGTVVDFKNSSDVDRTLSGIAAGNIAAGSTEAVNGGQIYALANALGTPVGPGGVVTPPSYSINGSTYNNVGGALAAVDTALTGGGIKYFHANSTLTDSAPLGQDSVAIGPVSGSAGTASITIGLNTSAAGNNSIAQGNGASASGTSSIAIGTGNQVSGNNSGAFGDPNVVTGNDSYAFGNYNTVAADKAFAIGNNITIAAAQTGSVGIGDGTTVNAPSTGAYTIVGGTAAATAATAVVSVGTTGAERQVTNVAAGVVSATSTDAVNGSQLFLAETATKNTGASLAALVGGGTTLNPDGTVLTAPTFTVGGSTVNNVAAAITALQTGAPVQYSTSGAPATPNGMVQSQNMTLVGAAAGPVTLSNVATPVLANDAANKAYVDGKAGMTDELGKTAAAALGAGSTYDPNTGKISAPSYTVGGKTYASTGSAIAATNALAVQYVADSNGAPTNAVKLTGNGNGQSVALTNVGPGAVTASSTDAVNGGQLFAVRSIAANSLQYDRNADGSTNFGSASLGSGATGASTVLRNVGQGVAATDAVNVLQLANAQQSTLGLANSYTDRAFNQLSFNLNDVAKRAFAGTAAAIALQAPALFEPGTIAMRGGMGYYRGEVAMGLSVRATSDNGRWSVSGGVAGGRHGGVAASAGIDFVLGN